MIGCLAISQKPKDIKDNKIKPLSVLVILLETLYFIVKKITKAQANSAAKVTKAPVPALFENCKAKTIPPVRNQEIQLYR